VASGDDRTDQKAIRVTNLRPQDTEGEPFWYTFTVQCTSCRETHPKPVAVNRFVGSSHSLLSGSKTTKHSPRRNKMR
jgi:hypothetical protein